jgi:hypothetical protein
MLWLRDLHPSEFKNAAMLAIALGHTDQEFIYRHYRELVKPEEAEKYWNLFLAELSMTWCQWLWPRGERSSGPVHSYRCRSREGCDGVDPAAAQGKHGQEQSAQRSRCCPTEAAGNSASSDILTYPGIRWNRLGGKSGGG